jgi:DNA-binding transcriptional MerR regulator
MTMSYMTIGEFAGRARLSPKALRLYDRLGLLSPARVDDDSGYRLYTEDQVEVAQLVGLLRRLDMPLALIASLLEMDAAAACLALAAYWRQVEQGVSDRRELVAYLQARLAGNRPTGDKETMYAIELRSLPERKLLTVNRHVHLDDCDEFFNYAFPRLRSVAPGIEGIAGVPFVIYYGEVSDDSDGPVELCRPVALETGEEALEGKADVQLRVEPAHDEAYIRLAKKDISWPALLPACDALARWVTEHDRQQAGALRQLLIADHRTATPETPASDLTIPLRRVASGAGEVG